MAIDARDNLGAQIMMARGLGSDIGGAIGGYRRYKREERDRQHRDLLVVSINQMYAADPNMTAEQALDNLDRAIENYDAQAAQEIANEIANEKADREYKAARAKYYNQGRTGAAGSTSSDMTRYRALKTQRDQLQERWDMAEEAEAEVLSSQIRQLDMQMDAITKGYLPPQVTGEDFDKIDITKLPAAAETISPQASEVPVTPAAIRAQAGPPVPPGFDKSKPSARVTGEDFDKIDIRQLPAASEQVTQQPTKTQAEADAAIAKELTPAAPPKAVGAAGPPIPPGFGNKESEFEPPSQEAFEQMVQRIAKTDRDAAKSYYNRWASKFN